MKKFDLNIEKILENWDVKHAVRELIANALDEQLLTGCSEVLIFKDVNQIWHIRDFGRGIRYEHFTQKENDEKLIASGIIGKFGVGLKDALATFERHNIEVEIKSKFGNIQFGKSNKSGFDDVVTLHAYISEPQDCSFVGSEFVLSNISDADISDAKNLFLKFNKEQFIETTTDGQILKKNGENSKIYINGLQIASEDNFLFSYNITTLNSALRKALNRERTNIGRSAYTNMVKTILLESHSNIVAKELTDDLRQYGAGRIHDELKWLDVQQHAAQILSKSEKVIFVTTDEIERGNDLIHEARTGNFTVIAIPSNLRDKLIEQNKIETENSVKNPDQPLELIRTFTQFITERNENFEFRFLSVQQLTINEQNIFGLTNAILDIVGGKPDCVREILVSETMQKESDSFSPADGLWQPKEGRVIIKRSVLQVKERFVAVLLHEIAHASSGASDATRVFETELTRQLGCAGVRAMS